ncbi:MAG: hypothetical protein ACXWIS_18150, partial [Burkholderiales bacterium]
LVVAAADLVIRPREAAQRSKSEPESFGPTAAMTSARAVCSKTGSSLSSGARHVIAQEAGAAAPTRWKSACGRRHTTSQGIVSIELKES